MSGAREQVLELLAAGTITPDEAERLLAAMQPSRPGWWRALLNPLELSTAVALTLSVVMTVAALALSRVGVWFDGPLDTHWAGPKVELPLAATALVLDWLGLAVVLHLATRWFGRRGGLLDSIQVVGVARVPILLGGGLLAGYVMAGGDPSRVSPSLLVLAIPLLMALVASLALVVRGFATVSGLEGGRLFAVVAAAVLVAEVVIKTVLIGGVGG